MFCWGSAIHGELGLGGIEEETILTPREVDFTKAPEVQESKIFSLFNRIIKTIMYYELNDNEIIAVACGENYTVLITQDGQIYSCGNNDSGQLGHQKERKKRLGNLLSKGF